MMKDKALEDLFLASKPTFDDTDDFMKALNKRLDAVEYIKQHEEATIRRYRYIMLVAFILGILCGGVIIALLFSMPAEVSLFSFNSESALLLFIENNSRLIVTVALSLLTCYGIVNVVDMIASIREMRDVRIRTV
ncbi:MAG: hypothetical protein MJZ31_08630 [Bacteroidales bacterium]|nr:hypothetical protein [Bacteroidales bacterium]